ncbi:MAG TPA: DNA-3-methyladenine glycosylase [Cyclobacteriaceae bacterium]|nr:DNA-3-methyladenine glycosylase [Cyclobacteriaceae bacterium]
MLDESFYLRGNVVKVAKELLGKTLFTNIRGKVTSGIIVETEAYSQIEKGSHAYKGMTERNKVMFGPGGSAYVYLCYGIHHLFNIVTNVEGVADAVLIRALEPLTGEAYMLRRMKTKALKRISSGPGKLAKAMGIDRSFNGKYLGSDDVWVEDAGRAVKKINASKRIGVDYAGRDALLPWRFTIQGNPWVSKP